MASVTVPPSAGSATGTSAAAPKRNYARIAELTWIWSIVGYSVLRFVVAWGAFAEHGANVWVFGLIDVGTAWPYAKSVAVVCKRAARSEWKLLPLPLLVAISTFFAPYAYLWFAAGEMPGGVRIGMIVCVSVLLVAASAGVLSKTRKLRRESEAVDASAAGSNDVIVLAATSDADIARMVDLRAAREDDDVIIDLTREEATIERPAHN